MTVNEYVGRFLGGQGKQHIHNVISLLGEGATVPFIARYRKEASGQMDEVQVLEISKRTKEYDELVKRKEYVIGTIKEDGKLSDNLKSKLTNCWDPQLLEELYAPYKKSRKTRADKAIASGLEPLAKIIMAQRESDIKGKARGFKCKDFPTVEDCVTGAQDIIAQWINENESVRSYVKDVMTKHGRITSKIKRGKKEEGQKFKDYYDYDEKISRIPSHRYLALSRGENEGFLNIGIDIDDERAIDFISRRYVKRGSSSEEYITKAVEDSYKRLVKPSIESNMRSQLKEKSDKEAIEVFVTNARQLLLDAPYGEKVTIGIDPGYRTGCKVACVNANGELLEHTTIYPHEPQKKLTDAEHKLQTLVHEYNVSGIAIGNGTASRETRDVVEGIKFGRQVDIFVISESGASIYSASPIAREEFPDLDLTVRGAISLARRLMDPLAELVKVDPKSIGVGQYQHDVDQKQLKESLTSTVESCVNLVGVNLNTASKHLLTYISGLGSTLANNIVTYRNEVGGFSNRAQLKKVPRLGAKAFEQCAGFLRLKGDNPLDDTAVHPEAYNLIKKMAKDVNVDLSTFIQSKDVRGQLDLEKYVSNLMGIISLRSIMDELSKASLDPRGQAEVFHFDKQVKTVNDLEIGMKLPGLVTNITKFGAFVNIGVKQDGMVHISKITKEFISDINKFISLGQRVEVTVEGIDTKRNRISLSMI